MNQTIKNNISHILQRIANATEKAHRNPNEVKLLLATKTVSAENIKISFQNHQTLIGENKIQEIKSKYDSLRAFDHHTHFIGHLQTNKIKELLKYDVACIQSLDRLKLAEKLQDRLEFEDKTIDAFLQFNTSFEDSKFGMAPDQALTFAKEIQRFDRINIKGLMTIGLFSAEDDKVRKCFQRLRQIQMQLLDHDVPVHELSMGMSGDLEIAIEEGATIVRVGTAIFGKREFPDSYYWNEKK